MAARPGIAGVIGATLLSGGGSAFLFDAVWGVVIDEQKAHIETLEGMLVDCQKHNDRSEIRLESCEERVTELRARVRGNG